VPPEGIGEGAFEFYGLYRGSLTVNQLFNTTAFTFGPMNDVSLFFGGDIESKKTAMAPRKRDVLWGCRPLSRCRATSTCFEQPQVSLTLTIVPSGSAVKVLIEPGVIINPKSGKERAPHRTGLRRLNASYR
jgi:hypothetical protein